MERQTRVQGDARDRTLPGPGSHRERSSHFRPDLEGLRAVAVLLVLLFHAGVPGFAGGYIGVDVFFVLSGFLITGLLLRELDHTGTVSLSAFYARRVRRLLPVATLALVVTLVASFVFLPVVRIPDISLDVASAAAYVSNIRFGLQANDYFAATEAHSPVLHFWSLSLEEQFYIFWPAIVLLVWRIRGSRSAIAVAIGILSVLSLVGGVWLTGNNAPWAFYLLPTRAWELGLGALLAAIPLAGRMPRGLAAPATVIGLVLIGAASVVYTPETPFPGVAAVVPVLGAGLVIAGGMGSRPTWPSHILSVAPMRYIGRISYSTYLWHWPLLVIAGAAFGPLEQSVPIVILSLGLAALTQRFIEEPFREGFLIGRRTRINLGQALAASLAVVIACAGVSVLAREMSKSGLGDLATQLDDLDHYQTGALCRPESVPMSGWCVYGAPDSATTVVLFGDSMAGQWFGAANDIATRRGWRLVSLVRPACPAVAIDKIDRKTGHLDTECAGWRELAFERIEAESPDIVLVANHRTEPVVDGVRVTRFDERLAAWSAGLEETLRRLADSSETTVYFGDAPSGGDPAECITLHRDDLGACDRDLQWLLPWYQAEQPLVEAAGATFLDTTEWLCEGGTCPVVVDGLIAYRDNVHLSSRYAASLAPKIEAFLVADRPGADWAGAAEAPVIPGKPAPTGSSTLSQTQSNELLSDTFTRTVETGWGRPDSGSEWVQQQDAQQSSTVRDGAGWMTLTNPAQGIWAKALVGSRDVDITARWSLATLPEGSPTVIYAGPRVLDGTGFYRLYAAVSPRGGITVWFASRSGGEGGQLGAPAQTGLTLTAGEWVHMRVQSTGAEPTLLRARVWMDGDQEPTTWQLAIEDTTEALQIKEDQASAVQARFGTYTGSTQTALPMLVQFDEISISALGGTAE